MGRLLRSVGDFFSLLFLHGAAVGFVSLHPGCCFPGRRVRGIGGNRWEAEN